MKQLTGTRNLKNKNIHTRTVEKQGEKSKAKAQTIQNHFVAHLDPPAVPISQRRGEETNDGKVEES